MIVDQCAAQEGLFDDTAQRAIRIRSHLMAVNNLLGSEFEAFIRRKANQIGIFTGCDAAFRQQAAEFARPLSHPAGEIL